VKEKIKMGCGLGCGTVLIFFIVGFIFLRLLVYAPPTVFIENKAVGYIIEHVDEFKDEINAMGYEVRVAYTVGERKKKYNPADQGLQEKLGYQERGILILERENEEYVFDVGFDYCNIELEDDSTVFMRKGRQVSIYSQYNSTNSNRYNIDFTEADSIGLHGAERRIDKQIKEHISAEELRAIYERCIGLQEKLVELYKAKKG